MYIDPRTDEKRVIDDMVRPTMHSACLGALVLLIGMVFAGAYMYWEGSFSRATSGNGTPAAEAP